MNKHLLSELKELNNHGINITEYLKVKNNVDYNSLEIIEIAYDIKTGLYINYAKDNPHLIDAYTSEISKIIEMNMNYQDAILDIGSGELTTLSNVLLKLKTETSFVYALEPNRSNLKKLIEELFRVSRDKLLLFEPSYELNSLKGKKEWISMGTLRVSLMLLIA
jgi:hypothetical protein